MTTRDEKIKAAQEMERAQLTPYDTGQRLEPMPWHVQPRNLPDPEELERYGRVDFDAEDGFTVATLWIEKGPDGYVLKGYTNEALRIEIESNYPTDEETSIHQREYPSPDVVYDQRFGDDGEYPGDDSRD